MTTAERLRNSATVTERCKRLASGPSLRALSTCVHRRCGAFEPAVEQRDAARQLHADATRRTDSARERRDVDQEAATAAATVARAAEVTYRTLEQTRGAAVREIVALLATLRGQHTRLASEHKQQETNRDAHRLKAAVATKSAEHAAHEMT